jgi:DNA integrity scanning protein DisA with diadenylate cyclase activity
MHCYLWEYGLYGRDYTEEDVCDLCAGSNDFVNKVIKEYSKNDEEEIKKLKEKIKNSINIPVEGKLCGV